MSEGCLLPPETGPTPIELALSLTSAERRPLDTDLVRRARIPWECPTELLPFLAHSLGVTLWFDDWSDYRKRLMCASALTLRAQEGTLAGIKGYLAFVDATVLRAIRPPAKAFLTDALSDEAREAFVAGLPQLRIYPFDFERTPGRARTFLGKGYWLGRTFMPASFGPKMYGLRATVRLRSGEEVPVNVDALPDFNGGIIQQLTFTGAAGRRAFLGRAFLARTFAQPSRGASLYMGLRLDGTGSEAAGLVALTGAKVQNVKPTRVMQERDAPAGRCFFGRDHLGASRPHLRETAGPRMIFDRVPFLDAQAQAAGATTYRRGRSFLGHCRFGIRPYTAELLIEIPMRRSRWRPGFGPRSFLRGYLRPADMEPLRRARAAIGAARAVDDTILIDPEVYRRTRVGGTKKLGAGKLGSFKINEYQRRI